MRVKGAPSHKPSWLRMNASGIDIVQFPNIPNQVICDLDADGFTTLNLNNFDAAVTSKVMGFCLEMLSKNNFQPPTIQKGFCVLNHFGILF